MKKYFFFFFCCLTTFLSYSQDIITTKSGEDIKAKVLEVNTTEIKFKKIDNIEGPTFSVQNQKFYSFDIQMELKIFFTKSQKIKLKKEP